MDIVEGCKGKPSWFGTKRAKLSREYRMVLEQAHLTQRAPLGRAKSGLLSCAQDMAGLEQIDKQSWSRAIDLPTQGLLVGSFKYSVMITLIYIPLDFQQLCKVDQLLVETANLLQLRMDILPKRSSICVQWLLSNACAKLGKWLCRVAPEVPCLRLI